MSANKKPVTTPLHLLQQLSHSLVEHLEGACKQALVDSEKLLAKLEKQRGKAQEKLHKARTKLQDAAKAGKTKAQAKARETISDLEEALDTLKARQADTRTYIVGLKRDVQESLKLAQGVGKVKEAAGKALESRKAKPATKPAAKAAAKPAMKTVAAKPAAKPAAQPAAKPAPKPAAKTAAPKPAATPAANPVASPAATTAAKTA
uniref:AlgP family protein n=1 Tax=Pseudomonas aeruginosa TaxID=287 RepID=UPI003D2B60E7